MYVYVYIYVCKYIVGMYISILCVCVYVCIYICVCMYVCMHALCVCVCARARARVTTSSISILDQYSNLHAFRFPVLVSAKVSVGQCRLFTCCMEKLPRCSFEGQGSTSSVCG
jgi:hypothetical protein